MDKKLATAIAVVATAAGLATALTLPAIANSRPQQSVSDGMLAAMQRDLNLDATQALARLDREDRASRADLKLRKSLGATYAGAWLNADATTFTVAVTDARQASVIQAAGAQAKVVARTEAQLDAAKARLDGNAKRSPSTIPGWHVDPSTNSLVVLTRADSVGAARAFVKASGISLDMVRFENSVEAPKPYIDVVGGNAYYIGSGTRCSIGFSVNGGFVTAGHCGSNGSTTTQPSGTFRGSSFPGNDYAWVQVAAGNTPLGRVNQYNGSYVSIAGSTDAAVGASVCRSGSTTGWHCGTIAARNASVTYPQGTVSGLIRTNVCAEPGDSGGSLVAGNQAQGMTSGGSGNCSSGGTTYFQPVNEALQVYGLTLVTSGGPPPSSPPPGGACSGYQNTYTGTLSSGGNAYQPNNSYYQSTVSGTHRGCLLSGSGTDFDLYLQKWNGSAWAVVAQSAGSTNSEAITYSGTAGYYRYRVHAYSGSGSYTVGISKP